MMKNIGFLLLFVVPSFFFGSLRTYSINPVTYVSGARVGCVQAQIGHLSFVLKLIEEIPLESSDRQKIVVLPKQFQSEAFIRDIKNKKLFVALMKGSCCVGYKKFFFISQGELQNILEKEVRCVGPACEFVDFYSLRQERDIMVRVKSVFQNPLNDDFFKRYPTFYTGSDYVNPKFRRNSICKTLYEFSLGHVFNEYKHLFVNGGYVCVVYGLAQSNDYHLDGSGQSRTPSIAQEVFKSLSVHTIIYHIFIARYKAYMPQFDDAGNILSDDQSVPGYGNCLLFKLADLK